MHERVGAVEIAPGAVGLRLRLADALVVLLHGGLCLLDGSLGLVDLRRRDGELGAGLFQAHAVVFRVDLDEQVALPDPLVVMDW